MLRPTGRVTSLLQRQSTSLLARYVPRLGANNRTAMIASGSRWITDAAKKTITEAIERSDLTVFMKGTPDEPLCGFSRAVVQILQIHGVKDFSAVNCLADADIRQGIKEYSDWPTIPQVYVKGEFMGGCDAMIQMHQSGELHELLEKHGLVEPEPEETTKKDTKPSE